jgi:DNA-binding response OmpR family regulator
VADGKQLNRYLQREPYDLLVLDLMMEPEDGLTICRRLRAEGQTMPILMLTAKGDPADRVVGLDTGADDYWPSRSCPMNWWPASGPCCGARKLPRATPR